MSTDARSIVMHLVAVAAKHGVDWEKHLPKGKTEFTAREVTNAVGRALTEAGVPNNLETP